METTKSKTLELLEILRDEGLGKDLEKIEFNHRLSIIRIYGHLKNKRYFGECISFYPLTKFLLKQENKKPSQELLNEFFLECFKRAELDYSIIDKRYTYSADLNNNLFDEIELVISAQGETLHELVILTDEETKILKELFKAE